MQHLLVAAAILGAAAFLGRRLYHFYRTGEGMSCGCSGCSGCGNAPLQDQQHPFPMYKP